MISPTDMHRGFALRAYLGVSYLFALIAKPVLRRRLARGKEHPDRWPEKLGLGLAARPEGRLIWLHAVGLGEVLSLRGLIARIGAAHPDICFLVTSTTAASADVFAKNAPDRAIHQFLPIDAPRYRKRFLDHFTPDLCVWVEQDLWPGFVSDLAKRGIPQCMIAARMNARSLKSHQRAASLYRDLYQAMALVTAQERITASNLERLGATPRITGSLKPAAPALSTDPATGEALQNAVAGRFVWAVASAHPEDAAIAQEAHGLLRQTDPTALLIVAPRFAQAFADHPAPRWSKGDLPAPADPIWLCDTLGDLGLVYRAAQAALIGGTFNAIEGHNPWEAAALGCAIMHGPRTANFKQDYTDLDAAKAALPVFDAVETARALTSGLLGATAQNATQCVAQSSASTDELATRLVQILEASDGR